MDVHNAVSQPIAAPRRVDPPPAVGEEIFSQEETNLLTEEERKRFSGICEAYGIPLKDWPDFTEEKTAYNQLLAILGGEDLKLSKPGDWVLQNPDTRQVIVGRLERLIKRSEQTTKALGDSRLPTGAAVQELGQMLDILHKVIGRRLYDPLEPLMSFYSLGVPALKAVAAAQLARPEEASDLSYLHLVGRGIIYAGQLELGKSAVLSELVCNLIGDDGAKFCRFLGKALEDPAGKMAVMATELAKKERLRMLPHLYWYPPNRDSVDPIIFAEPAKLLSTVQKFKLIKMAEDLRANRLSVETA
jgi:hypothetical protein